MKKIVFTLCANNYLAQARTLGNSLRQHSPDWIFVIGLVDRRKSDSDSRFDEELIEINKLTISNFHEMVSRYNTIELSTAIKPFFFQELFRRFTDAEFIIYLDPDILVLDTLDVIITEAGRAPIALTPHSLTPISLDGHEPQENLYLNHGIYNLGFLMLRRGQESFGLLEWWMERLKEHCIINLPEGYFVDQLWMNLAPIYFPSVSILRNPGLNMAFWNLHERWLTPAPIEKGGGYIVNGHSRLVFFHFSSCPVEDSEGISRRGLTRYSSLRARPDLRPIFDYYRDQVLSRDYAKLKNVVPFYENVRLQLIQQKRTRGWNGFRNRALDTVREALPLKVRRCFRSLLRD